MATHDRKFLSEDSLSNEICVVVGTRPGIIMMAPIIHELPRRGVPHFVVHTGQHYSPSMDSELFEDLQLAPPAYQLGDVSNKKTHGGQTAAMLAGVEAVLLERRPRMVLVNGDANTNLAAALAARKLRLCVGHIEAGERSFDWRMPEEHNRRIIDHISDHLFTTNEKGKRQLEAENAQGQIHVTGSPIVDAALNHANFARQESTALVQFGLSKNEYCLMTIHREEIVDDEEQLAGILQGASHVAEDSGLPILFLAHPRTRQRMEQFELAAWANGLPGFRIAAAVRYLDFTQLLTHCRMVLTDSGGVQQEAYIHRKPCVTLRDNTEWTETLSDGCNRLAGADSERIRNVARDALGLSATNWKPLFGDGKASERIVTVAQEVIEA